MAKKDDKITRRLSSSVSKSKDVEIIIERVFNAPVEKVWEAWTTKEGVESWFGPKHFTTRVNKIELKKGGKWDYVMIGPNKAEYPGVGIVQSITKNKQIVTTDDFGDEYKKKVKDLPKAMIVTTDFKAVKNKTLLTITITHPSKEDKEKHAKMGVVQGWNSSFEKLDKYLNPPFTIQRIYDADITKVWKSLTDKNEMKKWYFDLKEFKPVKGFKFQFLGGEPGKKQYLHLCEITEAIENKRLSHTWRFDGLEGDSLLTWELESIGKKTKVTLTHSGIETFPNKPGFQRKDFDIGWSNIVKEGLKKYLEGGK